MSHIHRQTIITINRMNYYITSNLINCIPFYISKFNFTNSYMYHTNLQFHFKKMHKKMFVIIFLKR